MAIDLFCGLGGWAEGFLSEGYQVIGFDIERHDYGRGSYPGQLVLQDARTLHGSQFKDATVIVASPPCTEYSYMAMPWPRAKQIARALECGATAATHPDDGFPDGYTGSRTIAELNELFDTCFRLQREASEAAGRHIRMVVENVRGAQRWVGRAKANYGSFYLWGDVGMVGRRVVGAIPRYGEGVQAFRGAEKFNPDGTEHPRGSWFAIADSVNRGARSGAVKVASDSGRRTDVGNGARFTSRDCGAEATKVAGLNWSAFGDSDYKPKAFNVTAAQRYREAHAEEGAKLKGNASSRLWKEREHRRDWGLHFDGTNWRDAAGQIVAGKKRSDSRRAASAEIAKIPFPLAQHIARCFNPVEVS